MSDDHIRCPNCGYLFLEQYINDDAGIYYTAASPLNIPIDIAVNATDFMESLNEFTEKQDKKAQSIKLSELRGDKIPPGADYVKPDFIMFRKPLELLQHHRRSWTRK